MNSIIKRLGKICLGLGVMLVPVLGFGQSDGLQKLGDINKKHQEELVTRLSAQNEKFHYVNEAFDQAIQQAGEDGYGRWQNMLIKANDDLNNHMRKHADSLQKRLDRVQKRAAGDAKFGPARY